MTFNPSNDIPDLLGKVILVTGGTAGIGKETVLELVKHNPACVYFTGRDSKRAAEIVEATQSIARFVECDMTSLASVQKAAERIVAESQRLDILILNAGVMNVAPALTKEGYEVHFGINHVAHALFVKLLLPTLLRTVETEASDVRVICLTSKGFAMHPSGGVAFDDLRTTMPCGLAKLTRYGQSKLANILFAAELARRYPQLTAVSIHPGVVRTELLATQGVVTKVASYLSQTPKTPAEGAYNQLWAATVEKEKLVNGEYYEPVGERGRHLRKSRDEKLATQLWEWTNRELEAY